MQYSRVLNWGAGLTLFLLFLFFLRLAAAEVIFTTSLHRSYGQNTDETYRQLQQAVLLNPYEPLYHRELSAFLTDWAQEATAESTPSAAAFATESWREASEALKLNPYNSLTYKALLKTLYDLARTFPSYQTKVEELGDNLLHLSPTEAHIRYSVALVYAAHGKKERARELIAETLRLKPDYEEAQRLEELLTRNETR